MLMLWWTLSSWAASPSDRDPLPALAVERPLATPRGVTTASLALGRRASGSALDGRLRYGVMRGLELSADGGFVWPHRVDLGFGARLQPWRREPPNRAAALDLLWQTPLRTPAAAASHEIGRDGPELALMGMFRSQFGPWLVTAAAGPKLRPEEAEAFGAALDLLLQLGPAALLAGMDGEIGLRSAHTATADGGVLVQISRGFGARVFFERSLLGLVSEGTGAGLELEISL